MTIIKDPTGQRFGRWTVLSFADTRNGRMRFNCECSCGTLKIVELGNLKSSKSTSCGCYHKEKAREANTTHGHSYRTEFRIWAGMIDRCNNPDSANYRYYGARGVRVCESWLEFESFFRDLGARPSEDHSLDRINVDGNYEPGNCRWATREIQQNNKRNSHMLDYAGERATIAQWARRYGLSRDMLWGRLKRGWNMECALETSAGPSR